MSGLNLLQLQDGYKAYGGQVLFDQATFAVNEGEHIGVIGPNGAGKSTLFRILLGEEVLESGQVIRSQQLRIGYLSQHDQWASDETGQSYLDKVCTIPSWQAKAKGKELQVSEEILQKPILSLSGGYRMRIKLLGLLGRDPNLMLLDEPTNYLDLETTLLLERFLQNYEGAFLLISHDREVLRRTTDHILEIESHEIVKFNGNIDDYFEQKELLRTQVAAQIQNQSLKRKAILEFVSRFGAKATKAKQAQSRLKMLDKMEVIEQKEIPVQSTIIIPKPPHVGKLVLSLHSANLGYNDKTVLSNVDVQIQRGDHVAVVGLNGAGKSTLLKTLAGLLPPLSGSRELGYQVSLAIFNQHVVEILNPEHTVYQSLEQVTDSSVTSQEIRGMAGALLFSDDAINKKIKVLSGGEKSRVALGRILLQKVPFLLLDEPTNHLDFQTVEALTRALTRYEGTLVVVSHDRSFIRRVGTKILEVSNGTVSTYPGTYDEYVWSLQKRLANSVEINEAKQEQKTKAVAKAPIVLQKERAKLTKKLKKEIEELESQMGAIGLFIEKTNEEIVNGTPSQLRQLSEDLASAQQKLQELESSWLEKSEELGQVENV